MPAYTLFQKSSQFILDLFYPPRCVSCKTTNSWLCENCLDQIPLIRQPICERCGTPKPVSPPSSICEQCKNNPLSFIDGIRAAAYFENNPIRPAIHFLKYRNHKAAASILGQVLADTYRRYNLSAEVIVPVPLHPSRLRERGYNQSDLLAKQLAELLDLPVSATTLQRTRKTASQMELKADERHQNVANAFVCRSGELLDQSVLLIDDVCTTGATLDACACALKEKGVACVWGITLAKAR